MCSEFKQCHKFDMSLSACVTCQPTEFSKLSTVSCQYQPGVDNSTSTSQEKTHVSKKESANYSCFVDSDTLLKSLSKISKLYSMHVTDNHPDYSDTLFVSGGLQQYLIRSKLLEREKLQQSQPRKGAGCDSTTFHDLPVSM